jgi:hypothetical protein
MNAPVKITATVGAYLPDHNSPVLVLDALGDPSKHARLVGSTLFYASHDMSKTWMRVGDAEITLTLAPKDEQVAAAVRALQGQLETERAESMRRQQAILDQLSKVQAIEYTPADTIEAE